MSSKSLNSRSVVAICPDRRLLGELVPLLSQHLPLTPFAELTVYPERAVLQELLTTKPPTLAFLDMASNSEQGFRVIRDMQAMAPNLPIVALLAANDPDLILRCLRQGATEFLLYPLSSEQLHPVLERLTQIGSSSSADGESGARVFCVMPVKGACGASTVASNLVFHWKRAGMQRILLADMDPAAGTISFLLKLKSNYSFLDALSRSGALDSDLWRGLVATHNGVDVLLSPENPMDSTQDLPDPAGVIEFCRSAYDCVTIDAGGAYGTWSLALAQNCDELLLVTTNELPALRATQRVLQTFDRHHIERSKIRLIVNRYHPDIGLNQDAIETALHTDVYHVMPSDYDSVQKALVEGRPVVTSTGFGKSLVALADRMVGKKAKPEAAKEKKKSSSWASLFSSIVSKVTS